MKISGSMTTTHSLVGGYAAAMNTNGGGQGGGGCDSSMCRSLARRDNRHGTDARSGRTFTAGGMPTKLAKMSRGNSSRWSLIMRRDFRQR